VRKEAAAADAKPGAKERGLVGINSALTKTYVSPLRHYYTTTKKEETGLLFRQ
jgi:hypothetical protein